MTQYVITQAHGTKLCIYREKNSYIVGIRSRGGTCHPLKNAQFWTYGAALARYQEEQKAGQACAKAM